MRSLYDIRTWLCAHRGQRLRLARQAAVSYRTVQRIVNDASYFPRADTLAKLDDAITADALFPCDARRGRDKSRSDILGADDGRHQFFEA